MDLKEASWIPGKDEPDISAPRLYDFFINLQKNSLCKKWLVLPDSKDRLLRLDSAATFLFLPFRREVLGASSDKAGFELR